MAVGCSSSDESAAEPGVLTVEVQGVPDGYEAELVVVGGAAYIEHFELSDGELVVDDLEDGDYTLEARTIPGEDRSWFVEDPLQEFTFELEQGKALAVAYEELELEVSDRAVGIFRDDPAFDALLSTEELFVGDPESDDYDAYEDTRELRFDASMLERDFELGDLLSFAPHEVLPYGYLGEVESIDDEGDEIVLVTRRAPLTDVVLEGSVATSGQLDPALVEAEDLFDGIYDQRDLVLSDEAMALFGPNAFFGPDIDIGLTDDGLCFTIDDISIIDNDEGSASTGGSYCMGMDFSVDHRIVNTTLDYFQFKSTISQIGEIWVDLDGKLEFNQRQSIPMMKVPLPPITFTVGPVPVTVNIYVRIMLEVGASMEGQLSFHLVSENNIQTGIRYIGDELYPLFSMNVDADPSISNRIDEYRIRGGFGPNIETLLYDAAGPTLGASSFLELEVEVGARSWWQLYGGTAGFIGFRLQLPGLPFISWSEEIRVAETRHLLHQAPFGDRGYTYYGESEMLPEEKLLPCTTFEGARAYVYDTYNREPEVFFESSYYEDDDFEFLGSIPYDDEGRRHAWQVDGFEVPRTPIGLSPVLFTMRSDDRLLLRHFFEFDGTGAALNWTSEVPDGMDPAVATMTRLNHPNYQSHEWQETLEGEVDLDCVPPGQYRLEVESRYDEETDTYYRPVLYDYDDFNSSDPLAIGDVDDGLTYDFTTGSAQAWNMSPSINSRYRLRYEDIPVTKLTTTISQGTEYLADDPAVLTIEHEDQSWDVEFTEDTTSHLLRFHESGNYQFHLEPPSHYQGLEVTGSMATDELHLSLGDHASLGGSLFVSSPWVGYPESSVNQLEQEGGDVDISWQAENVNGHTIEVAPAIGDPLELDSETQSATLEFPANDTLEAIDYTVTIIGHGVDGETNETTLDVQVLGLQPASLSLQSLGLDSQATATAVIDGPQGDSWTLDGDFPASLNDLYPGLYTITPGDATGELYDYSADPITVDLSAGQNESLTISYAATTGLLNLGATNLSDLTYDDLATISGPDGFQETLDDASAQWTHLSPGTYTVDAADDLAHSDGSTFAPESATLDLSVNAGEQTSHTLEYERIEGWLELELSSGLAPEPPTVDILDSGGSSAATVDESGGLWLAPGTYTLSSPGYVDDGELYFTTGLSSITIDSDATTEVALAHERVDGVFSASPASISEDQPTTELNWDIEGDDSLSLELDPDIGAVDLAGTQSITATSDQLDSLDELTYTLTISNDAGAVDWELTIPIEEDLPVLQWATVNGADSAIVAPEDELTFEWEVTGPTPDWWDLPFLFEPLEDMEMSGSHTVTAWDINCWQYCFFGVEHELDDGSWHVDGIELEIFVGEEPSFNDAFDDELYTIGGQTYTVELDTATDDELALDVDLDDSMVESIDYVRSFFPSEEYLEIEMADDAVGTETLELTLGDVFGDLDFELTVHAGVVNGDDDVDDPPPGSLRWVADQEPETIRFDPDVFDADADPIVLHEAISFDHPVTLKGTGPDSTILERADDFDDTTSDAALAFTNFDGDTSMEYALYDLAINDSPRQALNFQHADVQHALLDNIHLEGNGWALDADDGPEVQSPIIFTGGTDASDDDNSLRIVDSYIGDNRGWEAGAINAQTHLMEVENTTIEDNTTLRDVSSSAALRYVQTESTLTDDQGLIIEDSTIAHNTKSGINAAGSVELRNTVVTGHDDEDFAGVDAAARTSGDVDIINPRFFRFLDGSALTDNHYGLYDRSGEHGCVDVSSDTTIEDNEVDIFHQGSGQHLCP